MLSNRDKKGVKLYSTHSEVALIRCSTHLGGLLLFYILLCTAPALGILFIEYFLFDIAPTLIILFVEYF